jgi:hypothetical protein
VTVRKQIAPSLCKSAIYDFGRFSRKLEMYKKEQQYKCFNISHLPAKRAGYNYADNIVPKLNIGAEKSAFHRFSTGTGPAVYRKCETLPKR